MRSKWFGLIVGLAVLSIGHVAFASNEIWWQPYTVDDNTVSLYHLDEGTGTVITSETGIDYDGTKCNGSFADWTSGEFDGGLMFNNDRRVQFTYGLYGGMSESTIEFWAKPVDTDGMGFKAGTMFNQFLLNNNRFVIDVNNGKFRVWKTINGIAAAMWGTTDIPDGNWHHVALVQDGTNWTLYVDGNAEATEKETAVMSYFVDGSTSRTYLGCTYIGGSGTVANYEGYLDEVRISDIARTYGPKPTLVPGDANGDGMVDVGDLGILAANYGLTSGAAWAQGDFNADGAVDVGDLGILAANYGTGTSAAADFNADYAKVFGATADTSDEISTTDDSSSTACSSLGLPLIAGLLVAGLLLVKLEE